MTTTEKDDLDLPDLPPPRVEADLPMLEGWERNRDVSQEDLRGFLRQECFEGEVDPARIESITYEDHVAVDEQSSLPILGATQRDLDRSTGDVLNSHIRVYRDLEAERTQDPAEARARVLSTVAHEVGHTVWADATPDSRAWYGREVVGWERTHRQRAGSVSDYAETGAEEHFCEAYGKRMVEPEKLAILDTRRAEGHRLEDGLAQVRASAAQERQA